MQMEEGIVELGETRIIKSIGESAALAKELITQTRNEVMIILASDRTVRRNLEMYNDLLKAGREKGFKIRVLAPIEPNDSAAGLLEGTEWRSVEPMNVGIAIYDRKSMLITQYVDASARSHENAFISNIYTTNKQTIAGMVSVFEALWRESELRTREMRAKEREVRARRQAQLLQDILTHDIRNYNQVSRLTAELMKEEAQGNRSMEELAESLLASIDGSTTLVDRAKSLGRIVSEENPKLRPVDLNSFLDVSVELIREAYPKKQINVKKFAESTSEEEVREFEDVYVMADDLLSEVFSNIFSNSVKYTSSDNVDISIRVDNKSLPPPPQSNGTGPRGVAIYNGALTVGVNQVMPEESPPGIAGQQAASYVRISISDKGRGIPEELRPILFSRYLVGARGSGLGLSIVHALVVDRYKGAVSISNKAAEDNGGGTVVQVWLLKASSDQGL